MTPAVPHRMSTTNAVSPAAPRQRRMTTQDQSEAITFLKAKAASLGLPVETISTRISIVVLGSDRAPKLKRAVRFAYLDFSTAERRLAACQAYFSGTDGRRPTCISAFAGSRARLTDGWPWMGRVPGRRRGGDAPLRAGGFVRQLGAAGCAHATAGDRSRSPDRGLPSRGGRQLRARRCRWHRGCAQGQRPGAARDVPRLG